MDRRTFLRGMVATACAPAIVKAENLMNIWVPPTPETIGVPSPGFIRKDMGGYGYTYLMECQGHCRWVDDRDGNLERFQAAGFEFVRG